jgi:hypothetical protein
LGRLPVGSAILNDSGREPIAVADPVRRPATSARTEGAESSDQAGQRKDHVRDSRAWREDAAQATPKSCCPLAFLREYFALAPLLYPLNYGKK